VLRLEIGCSLVGDGGCLALNRLEVDLNPRQVRRKLQRRLATPAAFEQLFSDAAFAFLNLDATLQIYCLLHMHT
jgi:hypothetical protein